MQQISSRTTFFNKRIFPLVWFGFLGIFVVIILFTKNGGGSSPLIMLLVPVFMAGIGILVMKKLVWDLADQVLDAGDSLVVRFGSEEERIPLSNIMNIGYSYLMSPARVSLMLRTPGRFGNEVSFAAPQSFVPFAKSPLIADLIQRVDAARQDSK